MTTFHIKIKEDKLLQFPKYNKEGDLVLERWNPMWRQKPKPHTGFVVYVSETQGRKFTYWGQRRDSHITLPNELSTGIIVLFEWRRFWKFKDKEANQWLKDNKIRSSITAKLVKIEEDRLAFDVV